MKTPYPYKVDVAVLLLFHARPDNFSHVWAEVKKARPSRLFLYQDGPRMIDMNGRGIEDVRQSVDYEGIMACRELVCDENIDWQCEIYRNYQNLNQGCDPSGFLSHRWAFSLTDKCIVLEDDCVPSQSFFIFCKEMLDRYEKDEHITMIAGFNTDDTSPNTSSYFFTRVFSIWGWASWSRVVNNWDENYNFVKDPQKFNLLCEKVIKYKQKKDMPAMCQWHSASGKQYFESIFWAYMLLNDGLAIMPSRNMINNIGINSGTHYSTQLDLIPKRQRHLFTMMRHEINFPLLHPTEVKEDPSYQYRNYLINAWNNPWRKTQYSLEELWLNLCHGNFSAIRHSLFNRINKWLGKTKHI